jgi:hypothetical protein
MHLDIHRDNRKPEPRRRPPLTACKRCSSSRGITVTRPPMPNCSSPVHAFRKLRVLGDRRISLSTKQNSCQAEKFFLWITPDRAAAGESSRGGCNRREAVGPVTRRVPHGRLDVAGWIETLGQPPSTPSLQAHAHAPFRNRNVSPALSNSSPRKIVPLVGLSISFRRSCTAQASNITIPARPVSSCTL